MKKQVLGLLLGFGGLAVLLTVLSLHIGTAQSNPPGASVSTVVQVPSSMRSSPFNVSRSLTLPPGFAISVYARISKPRFMAVAQNGDLFVSQPANGQIRIIRDVGGTISFFTYATGLKQPHDMVFRTVGSVNYLYVSESNAISRYVYQTGDTAGGQRQVIIANLPDSSTPQLQGAYGHALKNFAIGPDNKIYVAIASASNASPSDATSNPIRSAVYQYNLDGTGGRLFAKGLRNAEGLAILPGTSTLWVTVNNRDNIGYPFHQDWDGDGGDDYGKVMQSYVDNHPPEGFTSVVNGGNYGWPYANANPDSPSKLTDMPFDPDVQNNPNWSNVPQSALTKFDKGILAHSAPLGFSFLQNTAVASLYRNGAVIALHGSWNRARRTGYKIAYFPWGSAQPGNQIDFVTGWLDTNTNSFWGRPVDVVPGLAGELFISDDYSGTIYKLTYGGTTSPPPTPPSPPTPPPAPPKPPAPPAGQSVTNFTLVNADKDQVISPYGSITGNVTISLRSLPTSNIGFEAKTSPARVGSVKLSLVGPMSYRSSQSNPPYALQNGENNDIRPLTPRPVPGSYTLTATPYTGWIGTGTAGTAKVVTITFIP